MMDENRRSFLKQAGCAALGLGCGFPLLTAGCALQEGSANTRDSKKQWGMVVDIGKCLQEEVRLACINACNREHNVPEIPDPEEEVKWLWSEQYGDVFPDQTHRRSNMNALPVLVLCNHCTNPPCAKVCPTEATWKRKEDGVVMMDMHRCIGCRYCMAACPYGARSFNWRDPREYIGKDEKGELPSDYPTRTIGVVEKCNFCAERIRTAESSGQEAEPACVEAARQVEGGQGALVFGDLGDPNSNVCRILRERNTICRRVGLGTGPNVFYIV